VRQRLIRLGAALLGLLLLAAGWLWHVNYNDGVVLDAAAPTGDGEQLRLRGAYLARVGNCLGCHTARGGIPGAGGQPIATPFGTVYTSNLTPDADTGIGRWHAASFWRALHHGRSADGRLLVPVFPYTHTTLLTRQDADALYTYFSSLPPTRASTPRHELRWPYGSQLALAVWRALYFRPGSYQPNPDQSADWNRGAYLVRGVAHCSACHAPRDRLGGANWQNLDGGVMTAQGWYAPSLTSPHEAGLHDWSRQDIAALLKTGVAPGASVSGPMAEVVLQGTQHLRTDDVLAMASYLKTQPLTEAAPPPTSPAPPSARSANGEKLYERHCAACHGERGQGVPGAYPALAGNRAVTQPHTENLVQIVLHGGFAPATAGNPRPYGMPPFTLSLNDGELAAVLSHLRRSWGNQASELSALDVYRARADTDARLR